MGKMKTDSVEFTTRRSLRELTEALRRAADATRADVEQLEDDPFEVSDDIKPQVAVLLSGSNFMGGSRMWGVQVMLYDLGDRRVCQLVALGEGFGAGVMSYYTGGYFELRDGKRRRAKILSILTKDDPTAQKGILLDDEPSHATSPETTTPSSTGMTAVPTAAAAPVMEAAPAAVSQPHPAASAASAPSTVHYPVSPDGVDPNSSDLFQKMLWAKSANADFPQEKLDAIATTLFSLNCEKFAEQRPDLPAHSELMLIRALGTQEGSEEYHIYEPYLALFPDQAEAVNRATTAITEWADSHDDDAFAILLRANVFLLADERETANESLYQVLVLESKGASTDELRVDWIQTALACGFEDWYVQRFSAALQPSLQTGGSRLIETLNRSRVEMPTNTAEQANGFTPASPTMQTPSPSSAVPTITTSVAATTSAATQSSDAAPAATAMRSSVPAPAVPMMQAAAPAQTASAAQPLGQSAKPANQQTYRSMKADALGYKIIFSAAVVGLVLFLVTALSGWGSPLSLIAPALWLVLVILNRRIDEILLGVPTTISAALSLITAFQLVSYGLPVVYVFRSLIFSLAIAMLWWLFALKKGLSETLSSRMLMIMLGVSALLSLIVGFGWIIRDLSYLSPDFIASYGFTPVLGIINDALNSFGSCAYSVSMAAAVYFCTKKSK